MDWIYLVQMKYRAAVKMVIKRRVPRKAEFLDLLTSCQLV